MRKLIGITIAATILGFAIVFLAKASAVNINIVRPKVELLASAPTPNLPFQVLAPAY
jgi:hypothetical protein